MWNGYTWIDQTTYLETASRDALDQMLFIEAERMSERPLRARRVRVGADGHHLRAAGRRERSRAAARHRGDRDGVPRAPLPASDHRLAGRPAVDDAATISTRTTGGTTSRTTRRWSSSATSRRIDVLRRSSGTSADSRGRRRRAAEGGGAAAARRAARARRARGHDGVSEVRLARAGRHRSRLLSDAGARRGADRREGREPLVEFPRRAAAAQGAALHGARRARAGLAGQRRAAADRASRSSTRCRSRAMRGRAAAGRSKRRSLEALERVARRRRRRRRSGARASGSCARGWCSRDDSVTNIAHQLGYFDTVAGPGLLPRLQAVHRCGDRRAGPRRRRAGACGRSTRTVGWFQSAGVALMTASAGAGALAGPRAARQRRGRPACRKRR